MEEKPKRPPKKHQKTPKKHPKKIRTGITSGIRNRPSFRFVPTMTAVTEGLSLPACACRRET